MANDARILADLPADVASTYPVLPRFSNGSFHFHKDLSDDLEELMMTYANGGFVSKKIYKKMNKEYLRATGTYLSRKPTAPFVTAFEYLGGQYPPTGSQIRQYYQAAENSPHTAYGYSHIDRYKRELQSVSVEAEDSMAVDWTFQTLKSYSNLPGSKAIFTQMKGSTKEVVSLAIVESTAAAQVSHLLCESRQKREIFSPALLYTDTAPHGLSFYKTHLGSDVELKLGLFHLIHRIVDTLDHYSEHYWKCLVHLKNCIYSYNSTDEGALIKALTDGSFSNTKHKYSDAEIRNLRHSKKWNQRFSAFLRKTILPGATIQHRLQNWIEHWVDQSDRNSRPIFTKTTEKVAKEQLNKVRYASDPDEKSMYTKIPAGPRSSHGLPKYESNRPESSLEKYHESMAHYANGGCSKELADGLIMAGTAAHNVRRRWKATLNNRKLQGKIVGIPVEFQGIPRFNDHSELSALNAAAVDCCLPPPFACRTINEDNGEVFLSEYFLEQKHRNTSSGQDPKTHRCLCSSCETYLDGRSVSAPNSIDNSQTTVARMSLTEAVVQPISCRPVRPQIPAPRPRLTIPPALPPFRIPSPTYPTGWFSIPPTCCFPAPPFYCSNRVEYFGRKNDGQRVLGRPPNHDLNCCSRANGASAGWR
jgi:hypothetical protein